MRTHLQTSATLLLAAMIGTAAAQEPPRPAPVRPPPINASGHGELPPVAPVVPRALPAPALQPPLVLPPIPPQPPVSLPPSPSVTSEIEIRSAQNNKRQFGISQTKRANGQQSGAANKPTANRGLEIIRETKLKVLQRHYEETLNETVQLERKALSAPPDERAKMEEQAKAMRAFLSKLETDLQSLADQPAPVKTTADVLHEHAEHDSQAQDWDAKLRDLLTRAQRAANLGSAGGFPAKVPALDTPESLTDVPRLFLHFSAAAQAKRIACTADGKLIAVAHENGPQVDMISSQGQPMGAINVIHRDEAALLADIPNKPSLQIHALALTPARNVLAVGSNLGQVNLYNVNTGELIRALDDEQERLTDNTTPEKLRVVLKRAMGSVSSLAFSPDGRLVAVSGRSMSEAMLVPEVVERSRRAGTGPGRLKVWDVETGALKHDLAGHSQANGVAFSSDGRLLASAGSWSDDHDHGTGVILWNPQSGEKLRSLRAQANGGTWSVAFSPDSNLVVMSSREVQKERNIRANIISLMHAGTGLAEWMNTAPATGFVSPIAFTPSGKSIVTLNDGSSFQFIEAKTGKLRHQTRASSWKAFAIAPQSHTMTVLGQTGFEIWEFDRHDDAHGSTPLPDLPTSAAPAASPRPVIPEQIGIGF
jgi:WD40 repeat protein